MSAGLRVRVSAPSVFENVPSPPPAARRRLAGVLIGKAFLELLLLAALVVGFAYSAFPSFVEGGLDTVDVRGVSGWAIDRARPGEKVEVQLYLDGRFVASAVADRPLTGVFALGGAGVDGHGFVFKFDPPRAGGEEASVYVVRASDGGARRTQGLVAGPVRLEGK